MFLAEYTYRFIVATAGVTCSVQYNDFPLPCGGNQYNHRILFATTLTYEADTLQVVLAEYDGVADILITENLNINNPHERKQKPFYLWPQLKSMPQFATSKSVVHFKECVKSRLNRDMWEQEHINDMCLRDAILDVAHNYDVVVVGSVDEILARGTLLKLKYCSLPALPLSGAIGMPMGKLGRAFKTDWHHANREKSFSLPTVYAASYDNPVRHIPPLPGPAIVGGLHMTNYCFLPAMIIKELWSTSYGHSFSLRDAKTDLNRQKQKCYSMLSARVSEGHSAETVVPLFLAQCTAALPAWYGNVDRRETRFSNLLNK